VVLRSLEDFEKKKEEIKQNLLENGVAPEDVGHVLDGCWSMNADVFGVFRAGSFVSAVLENNLENAVFNADSINQKYLKQYLWFKSSWLPWQKVVERVKGMKTG